MGLKILFETFSKREIFQENFTKINGSISEPIEPWIDRYLDGGLSQEDLRHGGARLVAEPGFADRLVRACMLDALLQEHFAMAAAESSIPIDAVFGWGESELHAADSQLARGQATNNGQIAEDRWDTGARFRRWSTVAALAASVLVMLFWFLPSRGAAIAVAKDRDGNEDIRCKPRIRVLQSHHLMERSSS